MKMVAKSNASNVVNESQYFHIEFAKSVTNLKNLLKLDSYQKCVICFIESPLKMIKNAFYLILKALFILNIFKFLSWLFAYVEKTAWLER